MSRARAVRAPKPGEVVDPYAAARFRSLWQVVVHATANDEDRQAAYREAWQSMVSNKRWREYGMAFHTLPSGHEIHAGYRFANPKDWYLIPEAGSAEEAEGPFDSKKIILRKLGLKTSRKRQPGVYDVKGWTMFTRDQAEAINLRQEKLP